MCRREETKRRTASQKMEWLEAATAVQVTCGIVSSTVLPMKDVCPRQR
jgi:hypothetical protein